MSRVNPLDDLADFSPKPAGERQGKISRRMSSTK
jgi:hypothetical protein